MFLLIFVAPLCYFFVLSFWRVQAYKLEPALSLANYAKVFTGYAGTLGYTFGMAFAIALVVTVIAFVFAYVCRFKAGEHGMLLLFVALITLFGGYLTKIYVWKTILGHTGILNSALMSLGVIREPIAALLYNPGAVIITLTHYMLPLAILPIYGVLQAIEETHLESARDLGANCWQAFRDVVLPQSRLGLTVAFTLCFLFAAGDYVTPKLVGGPSASMFGVFIQMQFGLRFNAPLGAAMAFTVIIICVIIVTLVALLLHRALRAR